MAQYIYSMRNVRKAVGDKVILDNVTLAFLPGAKIGVVGPNGAGKSTVLRIMAGLDTASNGEATLTPGFTGRGGPRPGLPRGPLAPGPATRRLTRRPRQRRARREADPRHGRPVQR